MDFCAHGIIFPAPSRIQLGVRVARKLFGEFKKKNIMNSSFGELINADKPVLIDFYATWCGPCQMLAPILKEVKDALGDSVSIVKVDVDKNQDLAAMQQVRGVPTLILYQKGQLLWRQSGLVSKEQLVQTIEAKRLP